MKMWDRQQHKLRALADLGTAAIKFASKCFKKQIQCHLFPYEAETLVLPLPWPSSLSSWFLPLAKVFSFPEQNAATCTDACFMQNNVLGPAQVTKQWREKGKGLAWSIVSMVSIE